MEPLTTIYLVRHAESAPDSLIEEPLWPLSRRGRQQADVLAPYLASLELGALYSSPYPRAVDTIRPLATLIDRDINLDARLRERKLTEGFRSDWSSILARAWAEFDFALPGCESSTTAQTRVLQAIGEIAAKHENGSVLLASHGNAIALLLAHVDAQFGFAEWKSIRNPDIFKFHVGPDRILWDREFVVPNEVLARLHTHPESH